MAEKKKTAPGKGAYITCSVVLVLYLLFLYWVGSWWGLLVVPFIIDTYITRFINWGWWKNPKYGVGFRTVMSWVDAIVFALVAVYFLNQFFFQNYVIPSSSLEKTLLTGDYLLVSKTSYGPRIPQTPLSMPLMQHTMPFFGCKSYLEKPHWEYRRVKGTGEVEINDIVVFNYPSGDTVAVNFQNQDYYALVYSTGESALYQQGLRKTLISGQKYEEQQAEYARRYAVGSAIVKNDPATFGEVLSRPVDRRENYVKRCVGLPGQTLQIKNDTIYLDGKANPQPEHVQYMYFVEFLQQPSAELIKELGITQEETQEFISSGALALTENVKSELVQRGIIAPNPRRVSSQFDTYLYPLNMAKNWTLSNYGPLWIPKKGETLSLTLANLPIYERPIRVYEGNSLEVREGKIYINGEQTDSYTFKMDYYWMMGDNRDKSADSRMWGFVPEDHVVGKPLFVWLSLDPDYGYFDGKVRWNRLFKWVADIR